MPPTEPHTTASHTSKPLLPTKEFVKKYAAVIKITGAPIVPHLMAFAGEDFENNLTITMPSMDAISPIDAKAKGKNIIPSF